MFRKFRIPSSHKEKILLLYIQNWEKSEKTYLTGLFLNQIFKPSGWSKNLSWLTEFTFLYKTAEVAVSIRGIFKRVALDSIKSSI